MSLSSRGSVRPVVDPSSLFAPEVAGLAALASGDDEGEQVRPALLLVLIIGRAGLEEALAEAARNAGPSATPLEIERCEKTEAALSTARVYAPDVILLDGDAIGGENLIKKLRDEALTSQIPIIVITPTSTEELNRWSAAGANRIISRWAPAEAMYSACVEEGASLARKSAKPIGEVTIEELQLRLIESIQLGLCDAVQSQERGVKVALGDGREITSALWLALARIREEVTTRSQGAVRFVSNRPEGAYPLAISSGTRGNRRGEITSLTPPLSSTRVIVADDDPAVRWFLSKILKEAGATVIEAADGEQALGMIARNSPHAVLCDVLMPRLDGYALCRIVKRDPLLRDVPFVMLSWREDLLQRVHELGAEADGYLRKEASIPAILQRLGELLRPRHRLEDRLRADGEVFGRLDGFTVWTLFSMLRDHRPDASVEIRDAAFVYEVEMREGVLRRVNRISPDGTIDKSDKALGALLGARAGRFTVRNARSVIRGDIPGASLEAQVRPWIARARAVQQVTRGTMIPKLKKLVIDIDCMEPYLGATPGSTRSIIRRLASGTTPKALLSEHGVEPRLLDDIIADLTSHNAILEVIDDRGRDLLPEATQRASEVLELGATPDCFAPTGKTPEPPLVLTPSVLGLPVIELPVPAEMPAKAAAAADEKSDDERDESERDEMPEPGDVDDLIIDREPWDLPESYPSFPMGPEVEIEAAAVSCLVPVPSPSIPVVEPPAEEQTSLELPKPRPSSPPFSSVLTPACGCSAHDHVGAKAASKFERTIPLPLDMPSQPSITNEAEVAPSLNVSSEASREPEKEAAKPASKSLPPSVLVTPAPSAIEAAILASAEQAPEAPKPSVDAAAPTIEAREVARVVGSLSPVQSVVEPIKITALEKAAPPIPDEPSVVVTPEPKASAETSSSAPRANEDLASTKVSNAASDVLTKFPPIGQGSREEVTVVTRPRVEKKKSSSVAGWIATAGVLAATGFGIYSYAQSFIASQQDAAAAANENDSDETPPVATPVEVKAPERAEKNVVNSAPAMSVAATTAPTEVPAGVTVEDLPLPEGAKISDGLGLVEVVGTKRDRIELDRVDVGRGHVVSSPLTAGVHELRARRRSDELPVTVAVKPGRLTRIDVRKGWHH
ncbi:MAG: response regulator [Polyangiaceae bacterium]